METAKVVKKKNLKYGLKDLTHVIKFENIQLILTAKMDKSKLDSHNTTSCLVLCTSHYVVEKVAHPSYTISSS